MDNVRASRPAPNLKVAGPALQRIRTVLTVVVSGAVIAGLSACITVQPQYSQAEGEGLVDEALIEIAEEMDGAAVFDDGTIVWGECEEEVLYSEAFQSYVFESGSFEDYETEVLSIWTELGYDVDESITERNGSPYFRAERTDGVYVTLTISGHPSTEGKVVLTAYSGCLQ
jgi:hypothetical protein